MQKSSLYPYQKAAVDFALSSRYSICAMDMGLGKTWVSLEVMKRVGNSRGVVFGPAFLKDNWEFEAKRYGVAIKYIKYSDLKTLEAISNDPKRIGSESVVVTDEVHYLKSPAARRTIYFNDYLFKARPKYYLGLTGTPIKNRIPDLYMLLRFCSMCPTETNGIQLDVGPLSLSKWHKFANTFCYKQDIQVNGIRVPKYTGIKPDKVEVLKQILNGKLHRVTAEEVLPELPKITRIPVYQKLKPVEGLREAFEDYLEGGKLSPRAKATSALIKAPFTAEYVESILEQSGGPVLIFTDHINSAEMIGAILKCPIIQGSTPTKIRTHLVGEFQDGMHRALVATIGALSVGVTLHKANHVVFNDMSWVPSDNKQAEKRIHRIGQKRPCFIHYIEASETDQYINATLLEKQGAIERVLDGD